MAKVKLELYKKSTIEKADFGDSIIAGLTDNPTYPNPNPTLEELQTSTTNTRVAFAELETARKQVQIKMALLSQAEAVLDNTITRMGTYVDNVSGGDEAKIKGAHMDVVGVRVPVGVPGKVTALSATVGDNAGEIDLRWDKVDGARSYAIETAIDGTTLVWQNVKIPTRVRTTLKGLLSGTRYHIRIAAVGSAGQGPWSDIIIKLVP